MQIWPTLEWKGFTGSVEFSIEDDCLYGRILYIKDLITYEGDTIIDLANNYQEAVEHYIEYLVKTNAKSPLEERITNATDKV